MSRGSGTGASVASRSGSSPAHTGERVIGLVVLGRAATQLGRGLVEHEADHARRAQLQLRGAAHVLEPPGSDVLHDRVERPQLLHGLRYLAAFAQQHDATVVHRVVERRSREHQAVEQRHRETGRSARAQHLEHPARRGAVDHARGRPTRANAVGITNGWPSSTKPTWQTKASSRIGVDRSRGRTTRARAGGGPSCAAWARPASSIRRRRPRRRRRVGAWGWSCALASVSGFCLKRRPRSCLPRRRGRDSGTGGASGSRPGRKPPPGRE